ncbi:Rieske (2Fe-2S) protein [Streptomyces sp. PSKA54]|uniref:Cytochrome bc1 complex Rieske iron-sulfur subunit n=1 Tax=Streptomyces himalayensis subsp. aureolus TaxID=2758039 RepID=A0A7W2D7J9_9ACTN|nr:Rieske (2Fe-2S) protein [Streptomyces himalayensis]MBA4866232.1 Rieske (2Fe-2S) protein [Streptomyces himalayensis subsp. aureolus]
MTFSQGSVPKPSRRTVVTAVGAAGLTAALAACGSSDDSGSTDSAESTAAPESSGASEAAGGGAGAAVLAKTSDIPVGGGKIFKDEKVVVTQPAEGRFQAFSNLCTHQQCPVTSVEGGTINCPCHNSKFSIEDGSVKQAPATQPLAAMEIEVTGDEIRLA